MAMYKFVGDESAFKTFDLKDCCVEKTYMTNSPYEDGAIFDCLELRGIEVRIPVPCGADGVRLMNRIVPAIVSHAWDGRIVAFTVESLTRKIRVREANGMPDFISPDGDVNEMARSLAQTSMSDVDILAKIIDKSRDSLSINVRWVDAVKPSGEHYRRKLINVNFLK